jgi:small GTP-binding protein
MPAATRILLYGLEKSGKSTIVESFRRGHFTTGTPSTAHRTYDVSIQNKLHFSIFEVGGRMEVRGFVTEYLGHSDAIIFVIDGSDESSFSEVKKEFLKILSHPLASGKPIAILFHKKDIAKVHPSIIIDELDLLNRYDRPHRVFSTSANEPKRFMEVLAWINNCLVEDRSLFQDKYSRLLTIHIFDMLEEKPQGLPLLAVLGQLEIISRAGQVKYNRDKTILLLRKLRESGELDFNETTQIWSITPKGRKQLQNPNLIKGTKYEKLRAILDGEKLVDSDQRSEEKEVLEEFELDELVDIFEKSTEKKR